MSFPLGYSFFNYFYLSQLAGFQEAKIKTRFYAGILVSQGGLGTYGVGWMRRRGRVPDGLPDRSPDAAGNLGWHLTEGLFTPGAVRG